jgi:hypothetical protein
VWHQQTRDFVPAVPSFPNFWVIPFIQSDECRIRSTCHPTARPQPNFRNCKIVKLRDTGRINSEN